MQQTALNKKNGISGSRARQIIEPSIGEQQINRISSIPKQRQLGQFTQQFMIQDIVNEGDCQANSMQGHEEQQQFAISRHKQQNCNINHANDRQFLEQSVGSPPAAEVSWNEIMMFPNKTKNINTLNSNLYYTNNTNMQNGNYLSPQSSLQSLKGFQPSQSSLKTPGSSSLKVLEYLTQPLNSVSSYTNGPPRQPLASGTLQPSRTKINRFKFSNHSVHNPSRPTPQYQEYTQALARYGDHHSQLIDLAPSSSWVPKSLQQTARDNFYDNNNSVATSIDKPQTITLINHNVDQPSMFQISSQPISGNQTLQQFYSQLEGQMENHDNGQNYNNAEGNSNNSVLDVKNNNNSSNHLSSCSDRMMRTHSHYTQTPKMNRQTNGYMNGLKGSKNNMDLPALLEAKLSGLSSVAGKVKGVKEGNGSNGIVPLEILEQRHQMQLDQFRLQAEHYDPRKLQMSVSANHTPRSVVGIDFYKQFTKQQQQKKLPQQGQSIVEDITPQEQTQSLQGVISQQEMQNEGLEQLIIQQYQYEDNVLVSAIYDGGQMIGSDGSIGDLSNQHNNNNTNCVDQQQMHSANISSRLQSDRHISENKIQKYQQEIQVYQSELLTVKNELNSLKNQQTAVCDINILNVQLESLQNVFTDKKKQLEAEIEQSNKMHGQLKSKLQKANYQVKTMQNIMENLTAQNTLLRQQIQQQAQQQKLLQQTSFEQAEENERFRQELAQRDQTIELQEQRIIELNGKLEELQQSQQELMEAISGYQGFGDNKKGQNEDKDGLEEESVKKSEQRYSSECDCQVNMNKVDAMDKQYLMEIEQLKKQIEQLQIIGKEKITNEESSEDGIKQQIIDIRSELEKSKKDLEAANHKVEIVTAEKHQIEGQLAASQLSLEDAKLMLSKTQVNLESTEQALQSMNATLQDKLQEILSLERSLTSSADELKATKDNLNNTLVSLQTAQSSVQSIQKEMESSKEQISRLSSELVQLQDEKGLLIRKKVEKEKRVDELVIENNRISELYDKSKAEVEGFTLQLRGIEESRVEIEKMKEDMKVAEEELKKEKEQIRLEKEQKGEEDSGRKIVGDSERTRNGQVEEREQIGSSQIEELNKVQEQITERKEELRRIEEQLEIQRNSLNYVKQQQQVDGQGKDSQGIWEQQQQDYSSLLQLSSTRSDSGPQKMIGLNYSSQNLQGSNGQQSYFLPFNPKRLLQQSAAVSSNESCSVDSEGTEKEEMIQGNNGQIPLLSINNNTSSTCSNEGLKVSCEGSEKQCTTCIKNLYKLQQYKEKKKQYRDRLKASESKLCELQRRVKEETSTLKSRIDSLEEEQRNVQNESAGQINELSVIKQELQMEVEKCKGEIDGLEERIVSLQGSNRRLEEINKKLEKELEEKKEEIKEIAEKLKVCKIEGEKNKNEGKQRNQEDDMDSDELAEKESEIESLEEDKKLLQEELAQKDNLIYEYMDTVSAYKKQVEKIQKELDAREELIEKKDKEMEEWKKDNGSANKEQMKMEEQIQDEMTGQVKQEQCKETTAKNDEDCQDESSQSMQQSPSQDINQSRKPLAKGRFMVSQKASFEEEEELGQKRSESEGNNNITQLAGSELNHQENQTINDTSETNSIIKEKEDLLFKIEELKETCQLKEDKINRLVEESSQFSVKMSQQKEEFNQQIEDNEAYYLKLLKRKNDEYTDLSKEYESLSDNCTALNQEIQNLQKLQKQ